MSYSQLDQDIKCLEHLRYKTNGYFVDIGAADGKSLSNTYKMEKEYGWKGICVEPLTEPFKLCEQNRPDSICRNTLIYDKCGEVEFNYIDGAEGESYMYSGISQDITCHKSAGGQKVLMNAITLTKLLEEAEAPELMDFLSLDTEGSELKILQGLDHNKYKFRYMTIEHNYQEPIRTEIRDYLESIGYEYVGENSWDDIYILKQSA